MTQNLTPHRRLLAFALVAALVAGACGSDSVGSSTLLAPTPIRVAGAANNGAPNDAALGAPETADSSFDRMGLFAPWVLYEFIIGSGFPTLPTQGNGWTYPSGTEIDLDRIRTIAAVLGLDGTLTSRAEEFGGGWVIGPDDGSAPTLYVAADGQLSWWFNAPYRTDEVTVVDCVEPVVVDPDASVSSEGASSSDGGTDAGTETPGSETSTPECVYEEPQPPAGILTADQARSRALDLLTRMGVDPTRFELQVHADQWYASVWAQELLGGTRAPVGWYFGFGAEGRLDYAGGQLAAPQEVGPYPLVDLDKALERLRNGHYGYGSLAADTVAVGAPAEPCEEGKDCPVPPEPETIQVTLTGVRQDLWWAWDADGTAWLLPAFTFLAADGAEFTVPAVSDEYLLIDETVVEPGTDDPAPPPVGDPAGETIDPDEAATLVGVTEDAALELAAERGWTVRIVARDGEFFAVTDDYSPTRVNLTIVDGAVAEVSIG